MKKKKISLSKFIKETCCNWVAEKCIGFSWKESDDSETNLKHYRYRDIKDELTKCQVISLKKPCEHFKRTLLPLALKHNYWSIIDRYYKINPEANPVKKEDSIKPIEYKSYKRKKKDS